MSCNIVYWYACRAEVKLAAVVNLVFSLDAPSSSASNSTAGTEAGSAPAPDLWTLPAVRRPAAALLDIYSKALEGTSRGMPSVAVASQMAGESRVGEEQHAGALTAGDAQRWAEQFVSSSFGDRLFAAVMMWPLRLDQPEAVQVGSMLPEHASHK